MKIKELSLSFGGDEYVVLLERKKVKRLRLRIQNEGMVCSCPYFVNDAQAEAFLRSHEEWILKTLKKQAKRREESYLYHGGDRLYFWGKAYQLFHEEGRSKAEIREEAIYVRGREGTLDPFYRNARYLLEERCRRIWPPYLERLRQKGYRQIPMLRFRRMKSRWGSCAVAKNTICLNVLLIHFPPECLDYVLWHECCHFLHPNHSSSFWEMVAEQVPNYRQIEKQMH